MINTPEYDRALELINSWEAQSLDSERFEYKKVAARMIAEAMITGVPLALMSPICLNYETYRIRGQRRPTIHEDLIWTRDYRHLRKGYVLLHEEIPYRLSELNLLGVSINYLLVAVDLGMSEQLYTALNPSVQFVPVDELHAHIDNVANSNVATMAKLLNHGLQQQTINLGIPIQVKVLRLTTLVKSMKQMYGYDFISEWGRWNEALRRIVNTGNNRWGALIREAIRKDGCYLCEAWGYTTEDQVIERVVDENFGLTAAFAEAVHLFCACVYSCDIERRSQVVMLDTIPGPQNPGHKEFFAYNLAYPDGGERDVMGVLRPFHNLVLLSDIACKVPSLGIDPDLLIEQAEGFGY